MIEQVGRTCYKSEDKITENSCRSFVKNLIARGHEAMIEHYNITVRLTNDRGIANEEVRHRIASFAQTSTRYCNYSTDKFKNNITYIDIKGGIKNDKAMQNLPADVIELIIYEWMAACVDAENHYNKMISLGATPQIARSVLNNSTQTELCITANLREWRNIFKLRCAPAAHPSMREIMIPLLHEFQRLIPIVFDDIEVLD